MTSPFIEVYRGDAPVIISMPHTGTVIPADIETGLVSPWLGRKDADWWVERLYGFAAEIGATTLRTTLSRTVIDVNRDPSGASLYPGAATTGLCPSTTFDGEPLYRSRRAISQAEIDRRTRRYFLPYHEALAAEITRLRAIHPHIVLYEAHSIRSRVPRLFGGELPNFNIGTNAGASCDPSLTTAVETICDAGDYSRVTNGRFKGGYTTRHYGVPAHGVHAIQMELACRGYMDEPHEPSPANWPTPYDPQRAGPMRRTLKSILLACNSFTTDKA